MTRAQALALTAKLVAAYPHPRVEQLTIDVYAEQIEKLAIFDAGLEAVNRLVASERMLPRIADVYEMYHSIRDRHLPPGLPEPPVSEEQRAENLRQAKALLERLAKSNVMEMH